MPQRVPLASTRVYAWNRCSVARPAALGTSVTEPQNSTLPANGGTSSANPVDISSDTAKSNAST